MHDRRAREAQRLEGGTACLQTGPPSYGHSQRLSSPAVDVDRDAIGRRAVVPYLAFDRPPVRRSRSASTASEERALVTGVGDALSGPHREIGGEQHGIGGIARSPGASTV
jgi:hypothetical protein